MQRNINRKRNIYLNKALYYMYFKKARLVELSELEKYGSPSLLSPFLSVCKLYSQKK